MAMTKKASKLDKVSVSILSAFLLMTGTHLGCRYDALAMLDSAFQKVSAETVMPAPQVQEPLAAEPVMVPSAEEMAMQQPTIARNPFLVPVAARPVTRSVLPTASKPFTSAPSGVNGMRSSAPVQVAPAAPKVKGIVRSNGQSVAIIEYKGQSNTYAVGSSIGDGYTVNSISGKSVSINGNSVSLGGRR